MRICECGHIIPDNVRFCRFCGTPVEKIVEVQQKRAQAWREAQHTQLLVQQRVQQLLGVLQAIEQESKQFLLYLPETEQSNLSPELLEKAKALNEQRDAVTRELSQLLDMQTITTHDKLSRAILNAAQAYQNLQQSEFFYKLRTLTTQAEPAPETPQPEPMTTIATLATPQTEPTTQYEPLPVQPQNTQDKTLVKHFPLRTLITDKIIGYWYAYLGLIIIALGMIALMNYLRPIIQAFILSDLDTTQASAFTLPLYALSLLALSYSIYASPTKRLLPHSLRVLAASIGGSLFLFVLYAHVLFLKNLWGYQNMVLFITGLVFLALLMNASAYRNQSITLASFTVILEIIITWGITTWLKTLPATPLVFRIIMSAWSLLILSLTVFLLKTQKTWLALFFLNVLFPLVLFQQASLFYGPFFLLFMIPLTTFLLAINHQFNTPKSFTYFHVIAILFYTNTLFLLLSIPQLPHATYFTKISNSLLIAGFFVIYWLFALIEPDLSVILKYPVSFKYTTDEMHLKTVKINLKTLIVFTVLFPLTYAIIARTYGDYVTPMILSSVFLTLILIDYNMKFLDINPHLYLFFTITSEILFLTSLTTTTPATWAILSIILFLGLLLKLNVTPNASHNPKFYALIISLAILNTILATTIINTGLIESLGALLIASLLLNTITWVLPQLTTTTSHSPKTRLQTYGLNIATTIVMATMSIIVVIKTNTNPTLLTTASFPILTISLIILALYPLIFTQKRFITPENPLAHYLMLYLPIQFLLLMPFYLQPPTPTYHGIILFLILLYATTIASTAKLLQRNTTLTIPTLQFITSSYMGVFLAVILSPIYLILVTQSRTLPPTNSALTAPLLIIFLAYILSFLISFSTPQTRALLTTTTQKQLAQGGMSHE